MSACAGLQTLVLSLTSQFCVGKHTTLVTDLAMSWKTQHPHPILNLRSLIQGHITRQGFVDVLQSIGTNLEASLPTSLPFSVSFSRYPQKLRNVSYDIWVDIYDWEEKREWWLYRIISCFPTWMLQQRLKMVFRTRKSYPVIRQSPIIVLY